jgi:hypothetical protein
VGALDPVLGRSYIQIAREGWSQQKSQNGGANPTLSGPASSNYHLWTVAPEAAAKAGTNTANDDLFHNSNVNIDISIEGLALLAKGNGPKWISQGLHEIDASLATFKAERQGGTGAAVAHQLVPIYSQTLDLRGRVAASDLDAEAKAALLFELDAKINEFQVALKNLLGLDLIVFTTKADSVKGGGPFRGGSADETARSVAPGEKFMVRVHATQATTETRLNGVSGWRAAAAARGRLRIRPVLLTPRLSSAIRSFACKRPKTPNRRSRTLRGPPSNSPTTISSIRSIACAPLRLIRWQRGRSSPLMACRAATHFSIAGTRITWR